MIPIGYDMSTVLPMSNDERATYKKAEDAFHAAVKVRDGLPEKERGTLNIPRVRRDNLPTDDPNAWDNRTPAYQAAQDAVDAAYEEMDRQNRSYFRLNIWGMGRYRNAMEQLGMAYDAPYDGRPDWPSSNALEDDEHDYAYELVGIIREKVARDAYAIGDLPSTELVKLSDVAIRPEVAEHAKQQLAVTVWTPDPSRGIYLGKFASNDDWWVNPAEINAALAHYRTLDKTQVEKALESAGITDQSYWMQWLEYLMYAEQHGGFTVG